MSNKAQAIIMGTVLQEAFSLFLKNFKGILPLALMIGALHILQFQLSTNDTQNLTPFAIFSLVLLIFVYPLFYGAVYYKTFRLMEGTPTSTLDAFRAAKKRYWVLITTLFLGCVMILLGLMIFIIPGLFIITAFSILFPVTLLEADGPWHSIKKCIRLVWGNSWRVFGLTLFSLLLVSVINLPVIYFETRAPGSLSDLYTNLFDLIATCIILPWVSALGLSLWNHLKLASHTLSTSHQIH